MRWILLLVIAALPAVVHAQNIYVPEHNLTYYLNENDFFVEEKIVFKNIGGSYLFDGEVYFTRGDARDIKLNEKTYTPKEEHPTKVALNLSVWGKEEVKVELSYRRSDMLSEIDSIKVLEGLALGKYPWIVHRANIKFISPKNNQFGSFAPRVDKIIDRDNEILFYSTSIFENISAIQDGFPVRIEYANFKEQALESIATAKTLITEAAYSTADADNAVKNAQNYDANLTVAVASYNQSTQLLQNAKAFLQLGEAKYNSREYSESLKSAKGAEEHARSALREATKAKNLANFEMQVALQRRIARIESNLTQQSQKNLARVPEAEEEGVSYTVALIALAFLFVALIAFKARRTEIKSSVQEFKSIDELKRRRFLGFERKVDAVKKSTEIAGEIRVLNKEKEKLGLSIENLRKKMAANEIAEKSFESEKKELEKRISEIDSKVDALRRELRELRKGKK
ncbi:MAG: hypothetical protein QME59_03455 [Candidatus Hydrothermarchaeota archaeon]|nr:hypothetical protein [Candidatus Hydrothermarchaeota archaeon]